MSRYDEWDDETFDLAADQREEERQAMQDEAEAEFDETWAEGECGWNEPGCNFVQEFDYAGNPYWFCEAH